MKILEVDGIAKSFGSFVAVSGVSFAVAAREMVALIGPNGAGKSTCFNMINGQLSPDRGSIRLEGQVIAGRSPHQIWRMGASRTFQITQTFTSMTVAENVKMALLSHQGQSRRLWRKVSGQHAGRAMAILELVGIPHLAEVPCGVLAYGDVKRVELAIALASEPRLLLMDEPTAGMAPKERVLLMQLVASLATAHNMSVLFTEHDMDVVFGHADRILVLNRGQLIAEGLPHEVRADPRVRESYLGHATGY